MIQSVTHDIFYVFKYFHILRLHCVMQLLPLAHNRLFVSLTQCYVGGGKRAIQGQGPSPAPVPSKSSYEHYHAALDHMAKPQPKVISREGSSAGPSSPIR